MTIERWARVRSVFHYVLDLPAEVRIQYLESACSDDQVVRKEVERLIRHHTEEASFLDSPLSACARIARAIVSRPNVFRPGDLVNGRLRIVRFIGAGGMGEVYEVADGGLGDMHVALKTIRSGVGISDELESQFRREVQIARQITHPNVCRIYDLSDTRVDDAALGGSRVIVFLTMELLEGESLADRLARTGRMSIQEALPIFRDIVAALEAAHGQGVIHRDLKSSNVMLVEGRDGFRKAVLTDFGLACHERSGAGEKGESLVAGTPDYMAPEQLEGGNVGFTADIFSLGVVLYELMTGRRPFEASSTLTGALRRNYSKVTSPRVHAPDLDARWEAVIMKCLAYKPCERPATASEVMAALEAPSRASRVTRRAAVILCFGGAAGLWGWASRSSRNTGISSIAILPFENVSGDSDLQYFAEGLSGDLLPMLTRFRGVRVVAPARSQLKGLSSLKAIGNRLNVVTVLSGAVRKEGLRVSVAAQLVSPSDGMTLWSGTFTEDAKTMPRIRLNLSMAISGAIEPRLSRTQLASLAGPQPENPEAYNLYLLGKHYGGYRTEDALTRSIDYLRQSIDSDPGFSPAYAALSDVYSVRAGQMGCPPAEYIDNAEKAAKRALELDPQSGEAHTSLGFAYGRKWDWAGSEREFRSAIRLNPGLAIAHYRYFGLLSVTGRPQAAGEEISIARTLDPFSPVFNNGYGALLYRARRYDEAAVQFRKTLDAFPDSSVALSDLGEVYDITGKFDQSIAAHRKALATGPGYYYRYSAWLGHALARAGYAAEAQAIAGELEAALGKAHYSPMSIATVYLGLRDIEKTFYWYDAAIQQRDPYMETVNVDPMNDPLHGDTRFLDILQRLGLS